MNPDPSFRLNPVILFCALLAGCTVLPKHSAPVIRYYQIDYPAPAPVTTDIPVTVQVWPMRIAAEYDRDALVYRDAGCRMGFYQYDQWIAGLADQMTDRLARDLRAAGGFAAVVTAGGTAQKPALVVYGVVEELAERRMDSGVLGACVLTITVTHAADADAVPRIVLQKRYECTAPCERAQPDAVVAAMSTAAQQACAQAVADIRDSGIKIKSE